MNAKNMNNIKKSERRIFRYTLADAWRDTISQVEVLEGIENKNVRIRERGEVGLDEYGEILYNKKAMSLRGGQTARL